MSILGLRCPLWGGMRMLVVGWGCFCKQQVGLKAVGVPSCTRSSPQGLLPEPDSLLIILELFIAGLKAALAAEEMLMRTNKIS